MLRTMLSFVVITILPLCAVGEDLATMLTYVPKEANALMAVDIKGLMASPMAGKEGWRKKVSEDTAVNLLPFPDTAELVVVAEQLQPGSLQGKWELVLIAT